MSVTVLMVVSTPVIILLDRFTVPVMTDMSYSLITQLVKVNSSNYWLMFTTDLCSDIDECLTDNGGCTQTCDNTEGSYQCSCWNGYELTSDGHTCTGM